MPTPNSPAAAAANIKSPYEITALEGIKNRLGDQVQIISAKGYTPPTGRGRRDRGDAVVTQPPADNSQLEGEAVVAARAADVVIYIGGLNHNGGYDTEGSDRPDLKLPSGQDELLAKIVAANPKTVVVLMGGGALEMDSAWLNKVPAVLYAWYPGMEGGNVLARVLFGDVNVSGKLPCTFPKQLADSPAHHLNAYPSNNNNKETGDHKENYTEGLLVGYRWFDTKQIEPLFPFGHGLSYTTFKYSNLKLTEGGGQILPRSPSNSISPTPASAPAPKPPKSMFKMSNQPSLVPSKNSRALSKPNSNPAKQSIFPSR